MKRDELEELLSSPVPSFQRLKLIEELALKISQDKELLLGIQAILQNCITEEGLKKNAALCSNCIHILIQSQRPEAFFVLLQYIKSLSRYIPVTYVEFLGKLLPFFGKIVVGPAKELIQFPEGTPQHAVGIQILCNLFLDGLLGEENYPYLLDLIQNFEHDPYFTKSLVEMVKSTREYHNFLKHKNVYEPEPDVEIILDDTILAEKNPG